MKIIKFALCLFVVFALSACAESSISTFGKPFKVEEKSITMPIGSTSVLGAIKNALRGDDWKLAVDRGPSVSRGTVGANTNLRTSDTFNTRYRMILNLEKDWGSKCMDGLSGWTAYDIILIDNNTGVEVFAMAGRNNCVTIVEQFMSRVRAGY